ncbi:MAG: tetratricopeptide repeat protein [Ignavibacteria bacterium]|nr:tetratricopeptide repeat protein [Ignavibacteria bacterium]
MKFKLFFVLLLFSFSFSYAQQAKQNFLSALNEKNYELAESFIPAALAENPKDLDLHLLCNDVYLELGRNDKALEVIRQAEKISSKPPVLRKLANTLSINSYHSEAVKILRKLTIDEKKEISNWLLLVDVYLRADSLSQAELAVARVLDMDKNNVEANIKRGDIYYQQRVYELSKDSYEAALSINPDLNEARMKLAQSYYWLGIRENEANPDLANLYFTRSLQEWNTLTQKDPKNARAWFEQGKLFFFSKNYVQAAQSLNNYIQLRPSGSLGRWYLAQSLYELGRCDSARSHLRIVANEIDTAAARAKLLLARCYLSEGDYAQSEKTFEELSASVSLQMEDVRRWGQAALFAGDTNIAVEKWKQAIEMNPTENCQLMYVLGTSLNKMKRYKESIEILNKRLATNACNDDNNYLIHYFIGLSYFFDGNSQQAIAPLQKAIELNPAFLWSMIYLGDVYANLNDNVKAEEMFSRAISTGTSDVEKYKSELNQAFAKLAQMKLEQKKYKDLEKIGKEWLTAMPENEFAALFTAVAFHGQGQNEAACRNYKLVLKINPNNKTARDNIKALGCE